MNSEDVSMSSSSSPAPGSLPSDSLSASVVADLNAAAAAVAAAAAEQHQQHQQLLQSVVGGDGSTGGIPLVGGGNGGAGGGTRKKSQGKDALGEEAQALKVRTENRERKKRWREQNEDRSKCSFEVAGMQTWAKLNLCGTVTNLPKGGLQVTGHGCYVATVCVCGMEGRLS